MDKEQKEILIEAVKVLGAENTAIKFIEEMSEAQQTVCKWLEGIANYEHICEEMADVSITFYKFAYVLFQEKPWTKTFFEQIQADKIQSLKELIHENKNNPH